MVTELLQLLCISFHLAGERLLGDHLQGMFDVSSSEANRLDDDTVTVPKVERLCPPGQVGEFIKNVDSLFA